MRVNIKLAKTLGIMQKAKNSLSEGSLYILYCSLVLPYIMYCIEIWGCSYKSNSNCLFLKQKRAVRIICNAEFKAHTNELFVKLKIIKFYDIVDMKITFLCSKQVEGYYRIIFRTFLLVAKIILIIHAVTERSKSQEQEQI